MRDLSVNLAGVTLKNPIMTASGTFNSGREFEPYIDLNQLGGIAVKGVSMTPWEGNLTPRIAEVYGGMLNAVGLQNPGVDHFIQEDIPYLRQFNTTIMVNLAGKTIDEYVAVAKRLQEADVDFLELNISCPNVKEGGVAFGVDAEMAAAVTRAVKAVAKQPLFVKLSPNVTDIVDIAQSVEAAGADGLSMINTLIGMKIDIYKRKPVLANGIGGLSGPAVKPVAVRMVYQVAKAVNIPIIGMGGIMTGEDAVEFLMAGASAVAVGTANLLNPRASIEILQELEVFMEACGIQSVQELVGCVH